MHLFRSIVRRALADWPVTLSAAILLLTAATVVAADGLYADAVTLGGVRDSLEGAAADDRNILISMRASATDVAAREPVVRSGIDKALATIGGEIVRQADASWLEPIEGAPLNGQISGIRSYEPIEAHAALSAGGWAVAGMQPMQATLPQDLADRLGVEVGTRLEIADSRDPSAPIEVEIVGLWRPIPGDQFWSWIEERGGRAEATAEPLVVTFPDLEESAVSSIAVRWWALPAVDRLQIHQIETLRRDVAGLGGGLQQAIPASGLTVQTSLPSITDEAARSLLVTRAGILALGAQFAVLAVYAVVLVSSILVERRRGESTLLRARGGGSLHLGLLALGEALLLAIPVALVAPWLASAIVRALAGLTGTADVELLDAAGAGQTSIVLAGISSAAGVLGLTIGAVVFNARAARVQTAVGRPPSRTLAQRLGIDLALVAIAGIGFWQLSIYGAPLTRNAQGVLGIDPLLVLTPAIGLLAAAVLATRFLPRMAEIGERNLTRLRGAVAPLAARHVARRPLRYTRSALLLMLAVALATFAALYGGTWTASQAEQATYRAAGDVRVIASRSPDVPSWSLGPAYQTVAGVEEALPVVRDTVRIGRAVRDAHVLALDPQAAATALESTNPDLDSTLAPLVDARPILPAIPIDGAPTRLAVTLDVDLYHQLPGTDELGIALEGPGIGIAVYVVDGNGRPQRIESADDAAQLSGAGQRIELPLTADADGGDRLGIPAPIGLVGVEVVFPGGFFAGGSVEITGLESSQTDAEVDWSPVPLDLGASGWHWERVDFGSEVYTPPDGAPGRIEVGGSTGFNPIFSATTFRVWPVTQLDTIAVVASTEFLEQSGTRVGDAIIASGAVASIPLRIVGSVEAFPTLDPSEPFVIVDGPTFELSRLAATGQPTPASEWWIDVAPGAEASVVETLRGPRFQAGEVIGRAELTDELLSDPVALGILGVLGLGSIAAMAFAGIAFLASVTVSTSERVAEFAILRALGLSVRQLAGWLAAESAFLLAFGLIAGSVAGILLGLLVLPFASFTSDGAAAVPAPSVVVPWAAIAPLYLVSVLLFAASVLATRWQLPNVRITDVLRGREESG